VTDALDERAPTRVVTVTPVMVPEEVMPEMARVTGRAYLRV
jgi:hypothetical protein